MRSSLSGRTTSSSSGTTTMRPGLRALRALSGARGAALLAPYGRAAPASTAACYAGARGAPQPGPPGAPRRGPAPPSAAAPAVADAAAAAKPSATPTNGAAAGGAANGNATAPTFQDAIRKLQDYWASVGCVVWMPHNSEVGAGTMNPATFLR